MTIEYVVQTVAEYYGYRPSTIRGRRNEIKFIRPRHVAVYLCRKLAQASFPKIAKYFHGRRHSGIIKVVRQVEENSKSDWYLARDLRRLTKKLQQPLPIDTSNISELGPKDLRLFLDEILRMQADITTTLESLGGAAK